MAKNYTITNHYSGDFVETDSYEIAAQYVKDCVELVGLDFRKITRMNWEVFENPTDELDMVSPEDFIDDPFDEVGFNPYMGCYDWDC